MKLVDGGKIIRFDSYPNGNIVPVREVKTRIDYEVSGCEVRPRGDGKVAKIYPDFLDNSTNHTTEIK